METQELVKELKQMFAKTKKELKFKSTFERLDKNFYIVDKILKSGFVSPNSFSRQLCEKMLDDYAFWMGTLHNFLMPNSQDLISLTECKKLSDQEKKLASKMISISMNLMRKNSLIGLSKDKSNEGKLIDEIATTWEKDFSPNLINLLGKIQCGWQEHTS